GEGVAEGQRREGGEAARGPAPDEQAVGVDVAPLGEEAGGGDAVVDVDHAPLPVELSAERAAVTGGAAVVDVDDGDPPAGPELRGQAELGSGRAGGPAVDRDEQRRPLT